MSAQDNLGPQWYHATKHKFSPGDILTPGGGADKPNYEYHSGYDAIRPVHFGSSARGVYKFGNQARGNEPVRVYQVEPKGEYVKDPGSPSDDAYKTWNPVHIVREVPDQEVWR